MILPNKSIKSMGEELTRENYTEGRWREYFIQLNGEKISEMRGDVRRVRIRENERIARRKVVKEEIMGVLKKMKCGKAAGVEGIVVEMLKRS